MTLTEVERRIEIFGVCPEISRLITHYLLVRIKYLRYDHIQTFLFEIKVSENVSSSSHACTSRTSCNGICYRCNKPDHWRVGCPLKGQNIWDCTSINTGVRHRSRLCTASNSQSKKFQRASGKKKSRNKFKRKRSGGGRRQCCFMSISTLYIRKS